MRRPYNLDLPPECVKLLKKYLVILNSKARLHGSKKLTVGPLVSAVLVKHLLDHEAWIRKRYIEVQTDNVGEDLPGLLDPVWSPTSGAAEVPHVCRARKRSDASAAVAPADPLQHRG